MYFLFSGEGSTDLGTCANQRRHCEGDEYLHGPMTVIADQIVKKRHGYSILESSHFGFVSKGELAERASELRAATKGMRLPGKKRAKETTYFFTNARILARIAVERQHQLNDEVVAILFRDSDDTASAGRGLWEHKRQSMIDGFTEERSSKGVPMVPKPKSEAWILCAVKQQYRGCAALEERSGNDDSPDSLKKELADHLGCEPSRTMLCQMVIDRTIDADHIHMPSFLAFRERLEEVI